MHRMWGELRRCEPAPHPPREGPRHVSAGGGVERGRSQFLSVRCVRESVEHCAVHFAQCSLRVVDCASAVTATRTHDLSIFANSQIRTRKSNTHKGPFGMSGGGTHDTGPTLAEHSAVSTPVPRVARPQLAARRRRQLGSRSVMLMHGYGIGTVSDMCYATCFISCLRNRLLSSLSFLKGDRGPSF